MDISALEEQVAGASRAYAEAFGIERDRTWFLLKLHEEVGELTQAYVALTGGARPRQVSPEELEAAFRAELADVFCHVLLLANCHDVDLQAEVAAKWGVLTSPGDPP